MMSRFLALLLVLAMPLIAVAQPLADRVPADAVLYIGWQGTDRMPPEYQASHLKAVIDGSNVRELAEKFLPQLIERLMSLDGGNAAIVPARMAMSISGKLARYPSAIYFCGVDMNGAAGPRPKLGILCQAGAEADALLNEVSPLIGAAAAGAPFPVKAFKAGDLVAIVAGFDQEAQAIASPGGAVKSIATAERFQQALAAVQKQPVAIIYADAEALQANVDQAIANIPPAQAIWAQMRQTLGLPGLKRLIVTAGFDGPNWATQAFVAVPSPRSGMLAMLSTKPLPEDFLKLVPESATWMMADQTSLSGLFDLIRGVAALGASGQEFDKGVAEVNAAIGMDLKNDVLGAFGSEWAFFCDPPTTGSGTLGMIVINRLAKPEAAEVALTKLEDLANRAIAAEMGGGPRSMRIAFLRSKVGDMTVHTLGIPLIAPSWTIRNGVFYAGFYPQTVIGAAEGGAGKGRSILDNAAFQALRKQLGGQSASGIAFANIPAVAPQNYDAMLPFAQLLIGIGQMFGVDAPPLLVPALNRIYPHLTPSAAFSWADDAGFHFRSQSPFPGSEILGSESNIGVGVAALGVSIMLPAINAAKERANRVKCASSLRQIGQGCILYANDHKGKYPPNLGTLVTDVDINPIVFVCPSGNNSVPDALRAAAPAEQAKWVNEHADYIYLGASMKSSDVADKILAYEKPENHDGQGINMMFNDGHVEWVVQPMAMQLIQKQQQGK